MPSVASRRRSNQSRYVWITAPVDPPFKEQVRRLARKLDRSTAYVVREALRAYLAGPKPPRRAPPSLLDREGSR